MSNSLPKNGSQFADRRNQAQQPKPTNEQIQAQQDAAIQQMRLSLSTQFLNTLIPLVSDTPINTTVNVAIAYADELLISLGMAHRVEETTNETENQKSNL